MICKECGWKFQGGMGSNKCPVCELKKLKNGVKK